MKSLGSSEVGLLFAGAFGLAAGIEHQHEDHFRHAGC